MPDLTQAEREAVEEVRRKQKTAEDYLAPFRQHCDEMFAKYRGFKHLKTALNRPNPPDRDEVLRAAKGEWGSDLVVPKAFSAVETINPRAVSQRPRMLVVPDDEAAILNVKNMRLLLNRQQERSGYELQVEETSKSGQIYGLGVQKMILPPASTVTRPNLVQRLFKNAQTGELEPGWLEGAPLVTEEPEDWLAIDLDIRDCFWDPFGYDAVNPIDALGYFIHRTWQSTDYMADLLKRGVFNTEAAKNLDPERLPGAGQGRWDEAHQQSRNVAGFTASSTQQRDQHEIWEFWANDGRVITILDREVPLQIARTPYRHGKLPFAAYRPTTAGIKQLPGIGTVEPMADLLTELSTLRSQRRDNAALKLAQVFAIDDGSIDLQDLQFFPGAVIPVHGPPNEFLHQLTVGDIPNSGYQEEAALKEDVQDVIGLSDTVTGAQLSNSDTATGVQLVQAAANVRIQRQSRRLEVETVARMANQAVLVNQQRITSERQLVVPKVPEPGEDSPEWELVKLGPEELEGKMVVQTESGSMAPVNMPERIQSAIQFLQTFGNDPHVDRRAALLYALEKFGFQHPESLLLPSDPPTPAGFVDRLRQMHVPEPTIQIAMSGAKKDDPQYVAQEQPQQQQASPNGNGYGG